MQKILVAIIAILFPIVTYAASDPNQLSPQPSELPSEQSSAGQIRVTTDFGTAGNVGEFLALALPWITRIAVVSAVLVIVFAGLRIVSSGGNPDAVTQAKEMIIGALLGLALIFLLGQVLRFLVNENVTPATQEQTSTSSPPAG